jgi:hypothetical protein
LTREDKDIETFSSRIFFKIPAIFTSFEIKPSSSVYLAHSCINPLKIFLHFSVVSGDGESFLISDISIHLYAVTIKSISKGSTEYFTKILKKKIDVETYLPHTWKVFKFCPKNVQIEFSWVLIAATSSSGYSASKESGS